MDKEKIKKEFFNELAEKLEDLFEKGELCSCGKKLPCRSKALSFNAYANIIFEKKLQEIEKKNQLPIGVSQWKNHGKKYGYWDFFKKEILRDFTSNKKKL